MNIINIQDFPKLCRICLHFGDLDNFFLCKVINVYKLITNIELCENDVLPKNVCRRCLVQLEEVSLFINKCKSNNSILERIYLNQKGNESDEIGNGNDVDSNFYIDQKETSAETKSVFIKKQPATLPTGVNNKHKQCCSNCKTEVPQNGLKKHYRLNMQCRPRDCVCPICEKSFYPKYKLAVHLRSHKKNTTYECPECLKSFAFAENLRKHALTHQGVKPFICKICEKGFLRKRSLDEHINFHTGKTPYVCAFCGEAFKRLTDHAAHIYHLHNSNTEEIPKHKRKYTEKRVHLKIECKLCGKVFASRSGFANHQLIHEGVKKFLCNICGKKFITNPTLQSHLRTHTGDKPFQCKQCCKSFRQRNSLKAHMSQHSTGKFLSCPTCNKKYHSKIGLSNHLETHSNEKPFDCPLCSKRFHSKQVLHNHLLNHREEKRHKCNLCLKSFMSPSHLNVHVRTHSGEKPFSCDVCGKQFAQRQTLKVHTRQHTGEMPYMCSACDKGFRDSSNLKRHFNRHHGDHQNVSRNVMDGVVIVGINEGSIETDNIKS